MVVLTKIVGILNPKRVAMGLGTLCIKTNCVTRNQKAWNAYSYSNFFKRSSKIIEGSNAFEKTGTM